jgi:uncharacterized membrane-anchored protein
MNVAMCGKALAFVAALALSLACAEAKTYHEMFQDRTYKEQEAQKFVESLNYQDGAVALGSGGVRLEVPSGFYFLSAQDARRVVVDAWKNPPTAAEHVLGMIMPSDKTPLDDAWGAVITYDEDGYVSDEDAAGIDYASLLKDMQESTTQANGERVKQGFPSIRLVGWASPPFYDRTSHKLHWAKELEFDDSPQHTLNYDVRALGRKGVLKINFVAGMNQLEEIKGVIPAVMAMPQFEAGSRYQDYVPGVDKIAAYGIGGLIAGKLLAKAGILAIALAFLKKGFVIVLVALGAALGGLRRFIARLFGKAPAA